MSNIKRLCVWPTKIPDNLEKLFIKIFFNANDLSVHLQNNLKGTDEIYLVVHWTSVKTVFESQLHQLNAVKRIYAISDALCDLNMEKYQSEDVHKKLEFYDVKALGDLWNYVTTSGQILVSDHFKGQLQSRIDELITQRCKLTDLVQLISHWQIQQQCLFTCHLSFPQSHLNNLYADPWLCCPSCKLMHTVRYSLECKHSLCPICAQIKNKCAHAECLKPVDPDKISLDKNWQLASRDKPLCCLYCSSVQSMFDYEKHLKKKHNDLFTPIIGTTQCENFASQTPVILTNGSCLWKIDNFSQLQKNTLDKSIYSNPFYLSPNGYKMCLCLFLNGDVKGSNQKTMSIYFVLMRGNHDNGLQWPFRFRTTFTLVNQLTPHASNEKSCWPNLTQAMCFNKPITDMNIEFGIPFFIPLDSIAQRPNIFILNNTMYIKFQTDFCAKMSNSLPRNDIGEMSERIEHVCEPDFNIDNCICFSE